MTYFYSLLVLAMIAPSLLLSEAFASKEFPFRSHEATYEMKNQPQAVRNWSAIQNAKGVMRYRINNTCDGWTVDNNTALLLDYGQGTPIKMIWSYTSFEAHDGSHFQFRSRTRRNGEVIENLSGEVKREDNQMVLTYRAPEERRETLPQKTYFPTLMMMRALESAKAGTPLFSGSYFDGSGEDLDMYVSTFTAPSKEVSPRKLADQKVEKSPLWDVDMAFYKPQSVTNIPELEIRAKMREDGITTVLFQNFTDFSMKGNLGSLTLLDEPDCS